VLLLAAGCAGPIPPSPTAGVSRSTPTPPAATPDEAPSPTSSLAAGLHVGGIAIVVAGQLRQVADPNRPGDRAFESPGGAFERVLVPLGESAHVTVVGGPTIPNGDVYWQVADAAFPGCCAPFGWVHETTSADTPAIAPYAPSCPDATTPLAGDAIVALGLMEAAACFGTDELELRGNLRCDQPNVDTFVAITGPAWTDDRTLCDLDGELAVYGPTVTSLFTLTTPGLPYFGLVQLGAHFNDASSVDCRWAHGTLGYPLPDDAPIDTAQFACRMSIYVDSLEQVN
jgi:hypothetical protein